MLSMRRIAVAAATGGLLVAGTVTALTLTSGTAKADNVGNCTPTVAALGNCSLDLTVASPPAFGGLEITVASSPGGRQSIVNYTDSCTNASGQTASETGSGSTATPTFVQLTIGVSNPVSCTVTASIHVDFQAATDTASVLLLTEAASTSPAPTPTSSVPTGGVTGIIKGYDNKCVDDSGNSSSIRAKVVIWNCSGSDKAEQWRYAAGELIHNGLCLDDKGNGGSGSKIILWTCNESSGEQWNHVLNNTFQVKAHSFTDCLDDPAYSKKNGTQLTLYTCHASSNQTWTVP
jgi:Ricin-type beta-trefoil lectin domain